jgi:mono/diheme cytochrome c family protein
MARSCTIALLLFIAGCVRVTENITPEVRQMTGGGNPRMGADLIHHSGCGGCHTIPGVPGAYGLTGPSLDRVGSRMYIAGRLSNTPDNMIRWIMDAPSIDSMTAMPNMGLDTMSARHIAAYLYTLR